MDPRGFPTSLPEFQRVFPDDSACARYLESLRWPMGFTCPKCARQGEPYRFAARSGVLRCRGCQANISLTAGTVMEKFAVCALYMVLGRVPCYHANARAIGFAVSTAVGDQTLRESVCHAPQVACWHGAP